VVGIAVMTGLVVRPVLIQNSGARYLCPYGALMGLASVAESGEEFGATTQACIDCGKCSKACPVGPEGGPSWCRSGLSSARRAWRALASSRWRNALKLGAARGEGSGCGGPRWRGRAVNPRAVAAVLAVIFLGVVLLARMSGHWQNGGAGARCNMQPWYRMRMKLAIRW